MKSVDFSGLGTGPCSLQYAAVCRTQVVRQSHGPLGLQEVMTLVTLCLCRN
jgi:hypothetical protein